MQIVTKQDIFKLDMEILKKVNKLILKFTKS